MSLKTPPDATVFRSNGRECYLYIGSVELRELEREWGLVRAFSDTVQDLTRKRIEFMQRLEGSTFEDRLTVLKHGLSRWAEASNVELTDRAAADIIDSIDPPDGETDSGKPANASARMVRAQRLHEQFVADCFGGDGEDEGGPKAPTSPTPSEPATSTQNGS